jgi:hypothetical protein
LQDAEAAQTAYTSQAESGYRTRDQLCTALLAGNQHIGLFLQQLPERRGTLCVRVRLQLVGAHLIGYELHFITISLKKQGFFPLTEQNRNSILFQVVEPGSFLE